MKKSIHLNIAWRCSVFGYLYPDFVRVVQQHFQKMERRSTRVSEAQWDILLEFLERNPSLARTRGYNNSAQGRAESKRLWEEIANMLNAEGSGAVKSAKEWYIYVSNYKSKVKKVVAGINADVNSTGGGPPQGSHLSDVDKRFLAIMRPAFGQTAPRVSVEPFPDVDQQQPSTSEFTTQYVDTELEDVLNDYVVEIHNERPIGVNQAVALVSNGPPEAPVSSELPKAPVSSGAPAASLSSGTPDATAPHLPRQTRRTRSRHRPLAPLEAAQEILAQVETQRAAADLANAQALQLIGENLGLMGQNLGLIGENLRRLADTAKRLEVHLESQ